MVQSRSYYKLLLLFAALLCGQVIKADYAISESNVSHHLGISIAGAECNNLGKADVPVVHQVGGSATFALRYEMQCDSWFWGLGLEAALQNLNNVLAFTDSVNRVDIDGDSFSYQYVYTSFKEKDLMANISIPIFVGKYFSKVYATLGLAIEIPVWAQYTTQADMYTQGVYPWSITPIVSEGINDFSSLGFYPSHRYTYTAEYEELVNIVPFVEVGYDCLQTDNINLRVGAYASCAMPLASPKMIAISDYSAVNTNPKKQNQQDLEKNIRWNPIGRSDKYQATEYKLEAGVKLTVLFRMPDNKRCMCDE